jgi:RNA polymerase sigma factor (sigma-70 family)
MRRARPKRNELFRAAIELVSTGSSFKATARRYSLCQADADDAYQRSLEILMTRAPTRERADLARWLQTVIKHEALAIRRERERIVGPEYGPDEEEMAEEVASPEEGAPERERVRQTAEALAQLKASEVQCLLLKAVGYSYEEISEKTGYSWTKVNRSLSEGRKRFFERFSQIESGQRCRRFRALLSAASDGEAPPDDEQHLKAHMRTCSGCRAALRHYRTLPARVAELLPPAVLLPALHKESWWSRLHDTATLWAADRGGAIGHKIQQVGDAVSAQKATAVVASTAALTGGAVVHERASGERERTTREDASRRAEPAPDKTVATTPTPANPQPVTQTPAQERPAPAPSAADEQSAAAGEFGPESVAPAEPTRASANSGREARVQPVAADSAPGELIPAAGGGSGGSGQASGASSAGEFGP